MFTYIFQKIVCVLSKNVWNDFSSKISQLFKECSRFKKCSCFHFQEFQIMFPFPKLFGNVIKNMFSKFVCVFHIIPKSVRISKLLTIFKKIYLQISEMFSNLDATVCCKIFSRFSLINNSYEVEWLP